MAHTQNEVEARRIRGILADAVEKQSQIRAAQRRNTKNLKAVSEVIAKARTMIKNIEGSPRAGKPK